MTTREPARPLQRLWIERGRAASLPSTYTTLKDATKVACNRSLNGGHVQGQIAPIEAGSND
jgi:hypothetical protein